MEPRFFPAVMVFFMLALGACLVIGLALALWIIRRQSRRLAEQEALLTQSARLATLGQMVGSMAHEINTPLGLINLGAARLESLVQESKVHSADVTDTVRTIEKTVKSVAQIIRGLRTYSRDGSKDPFQIVAVSDVIDDTLSLCREKLNQRGIALVDPVPGIAYDDSLEVSCRPGQIMQVLLNLLNNAVDALDSVDRKLPRRIEVQVVETPTHVEIAVVDSGPGIPVEHREKVLNPFFTTKAPGKGTGLGLSISREIIQAHEGVLELDLSSKATRFRFNLRKASEADRGGVAA